MKTIRASEIGSYLYCRRAWWYRRQGLEPANQGQMNAGTELHRQHGRTIILASLQSGLAWLILLFALGLLAWLALQALIGG